MNLKQLFNKQYFVQNILKSKAVLALITGIVPILNAIYLLLITSSNEGDVICDLNIISALNIIGMYVLPIVISMCLLGYVFKRKSTDFINSMPLTKKQIFITNTIGGIVIIVVMMLLNTLVLCVESLLIENLAVTFQMVLDYFIVWTIAYIFVFTISNLATALSGNCITSIIVTVLILFFIPFMHLYFTGFNGYLGNYETYYLNLESTSNYSNVRSIISVGDVPVYTLPFNLFASIFTGSLAIFNVVSIIKMLILSCVYIAVGTYAFDKRKMEVNETSFKNNHMHMIIRSCTMIPLVTFALFVMEDIFDIPFAIFFLAILVVYSLVYDLITSKSIRKIKLGSIYFVLTVLVSLGMYVGIRHIYNNKTAEDVDLTRIDKVAININDYYDINVQSDKYVYIENEELVKDIKEKIVSKGTGANLLEVRFKIDNKEYETWLRLDYENYEKVIGKYLELEEVKNIYKNINFNNTLSVKLADVYVPKSKKDEIVKIIKENLDVDNINLKAEENIIGYAKLNIYEGNKTVEYRIPLTISDKLVYEYVTIKNNKYAKDILNKKIEDICSMLEYSNYIYRNVADNGVDASDVEEIADIIIKNITKKVDVTQDIIEISGMTYGYDNFTIYLNKTEELNNIIKKYESRVNVYE